MAVSEKYLKELLREIVSIKAECHCEYPGCNEMICDPHHWISQENKSIRYDPEVCLFLCSRHHTGGPISAHRTPHTFKTLIISNGVRTQEWADQVSIKANQIVKFCDHFREEWKVKLMEELKRLGARGWRK